jgi:hypothetical protein
MTLQLPQVTEHDKTPDGSPYTLLFLEFIGHLYHDCFERKTGLRCYEQSFIKSGV